MNYPNNPNIIEADDLDELRALSIQTCEDGQEITLTFKLNPRKRYNIGQFPDRVFLTDGVVPRFLTVCPRSQV
jgi:hypothetical protein